MDSSLLVSLRQYRPREGRDSLENFITEVFAWLLRSSSGISEAVLAYLQRAMPEGEGFDLPRDSEDVEWSTQARLGSRRPDMQVTWPGMALIFEHKVWSGLGDDQINGYRELACQQFSASEIRVVAITASRHQHSEAADANLCWSDIHRTLEQYLGEVEGATERFHIENFLALLAHEGLQPAAPIAHEAIRYFPSAGKLPQQLEKAFTPLAARDWPVEGGYQAEMKRMRWGRIGIEFLRTDAKRKWSPGIFIGCVLDGSDHLINHRTEDTVKLQLILDFSNALRRYYPSMDSYRALKATLAEISQESRWTFYDHGEEQQANTYHPLYLETPLIEILRGSKNMEEQRERIFEAGCEALKLLQHRGGLDQIKAECDAVSE
ncbi:PD-(D/E)XK nuclease family protein [Halomonas denitrificans]|uniref:PD-(D/E)XK nuclease family protein n=1 Tax=Halomonas denitrificans TaxID=370769 RepID=UPI000D39F83C|nr:PD-(D/E)XK nuclease family protein [Halomonas denitrificans]